MNKKLNWLWFLVIILVSFGLVVISCKSSPATSSSSPATVKPTTSSAPTSAAPTASVAPSTSAKPSNSVQPVIIRWHDHSSPNMSRNVFVRETWGAEIEKQTQGRVKFEWYMGGALGGGKESVAIISGGVADGGTIQLAYEPGRGPMMTVGENTGLPNIWAKMKAARYMQENDPELLKEQKNLNIKYLAELVAPSYQVIMTSKAGPIKSLADLKGKRIRGFGGYLGTLDKLGAVSVAIPSPEVYQSMQRGVVDGTAYALYSIYGESTYEVGKYISLVDMGATGGVQYAINLNAWNKISPQDQALIQKITVDLLDGGIPDMHNKEEVNFAAKLKEAGISFNDLSAEDHAKIKQASVDNTETWIKKWTDQGFAARQVWDSFLQKYNEYEAQWLKDHPGIAARGYTIE